MLHIPKSPESILDAVAEIAVVVDLQASHFCAVQRFVQIALRIRLRTVTDFAPAVVILVSVVTGFDKYEEVSVVFIEIETFGFRALETTVERVPIFSEISSEISWRCQVLAAVLVTVSRQVLESSCTGRVC